MSELTNPHDRFFKEVFSRPEAARDLLQNYLPEEVTAVLDLSTLELQPGSFVDADLQEHFSDLLYRLILRDGGEAYAYLLLEHKSSPDPLTPFQLLRYMIRIWERAMQAGKPIAPIIPMVVYHGLGRWQASTNFADLYVGPEALHRYWPSFHYDLLDLARYSDDEIRGMALAQAAMLVMKYIFTPSLRLRLADILQLLAELEDKQTAAEHFLTVLRYVAAAGRDLAEDDIITAVKKALPDSGGELMQTVAEKWVERGITRGIEHGQIQSLQETVLKLVEIRFGLVTEEMITAVNSLNDLDQLRQLRDLAIAADSINTIEAALVNTTE
jgi:predicted transposase/invertase (TIGR01784 family)